MIALSHRFHGRGSLRGVYQRGQFLRGPHISLRFVRRAGRRPYRVAVVVSRKVSKSAVTRNRIRRRIYEIVRQTPGIPAGLDLVFTVFDDQTAEMSSAKLTAIIEDLLTKAAQRAAVA